MGRKPYYKNRQTGNYGFLEEMTFQSNSRFSDTHLSLNIVEVVEGMIQKSGKQEKVRREDLEEVLPDELQKNLLGF